MVSDGLVWVTATWIYQYFSINRRVIKVSKRLEEIKDRVLIDKVYYEFNGSKGRWGKVYTLRDEDYRYLMQQAERVQELEKRLKIHQKRSWFEDYEKVAKQNKRYREALEFYADERNYKERDFGMIVQPAIQDGDRGRTAREALEGEE